MKRRGYISPEIETDDNFRLGFYGYSRLKHNRDAVRQFEADLEHNLSRLLLAYKNETWKTSPYKNHLKMERKMRLLTLYPVDDHVIQWAAAIPVEKLLCDTFIRRCCSCVSGRGTHDFVNQLRIDMRDVNGTYYFFELDVHHFFLNISHDILFTLLLRKIKDQKLLRFLREFIFSYYMGLPLGVKISQILANFFLARFDYDAIHVFYILNDPDKSAYWCNRYVTDCFMTCRTEAQARELNKGVQYLKDKFYRFASEGLHHYSRFADNIVVQHEDKVFLHIVAELCVMVLARDYYLQVNKNWNVRPVHNGGIDVCGYVSFHDHRRLRKSNKVALCREVAKLRKKGLSPEEIRLKCASRTGFAVHADARNLLRSLNINMEKRLGTVIKNRKLNIPFKGMRFDQKKPFSEIVCHEGGDESQYKILLEDFKIEDSRVEKEEVIVETVDDNGQKKMEKVTRAKKCLVIRYKRILETTVQTDIEGEDKETYTFEKEKGKDGTSGVKDAEYYSFTGSSVMMDQATNDFQKEDLPCPTVIQEFTNKLNKKFYKFT